MNKAGIVQWLKENREAMRKKHIGTKTSQNIQSRYLLRIKGTVI
jgi:hypothetical protein